MPHNANPLPSGRGVPHCHKSAAQPSTSVPASARAAAGALAALGATIPANTAGDCVGIAGAHLGGVTALGADNGVEERGLWGPAAGGK